MTRWLEEFEMKHAEFDRCIKTFNTMSSAWKAIAKDHSKSGYRAFARRQSTMFETLRNTADDTFKKFGAKLFINKSGPALVDTLAKFHEEELSWLKELAGC
jgi:hypothetical protein